MRRLNLERYYDGLATHQRDTLFGLFTDLKYKLKIARGMIDAGIEGILYETSMISAVGKMVAIDEFMESVGKEPIFEIKKAISSCENDYTKVDILPFAEQFDFLMAVQPPEP